MATRRELSLKTRVLVIDEDQDRCELLEAHFGAGRMTVHFAHDGKSGLMQWPFWRARFCDPGPKTAQLTGLEWTKQLVLHSTVGIWILSGPNRQSRQHHRTGVGADECLVKPFNPVNSSPEPCNIPAADTLVARDSASLRNTWKSMIFSLDGGVAYLSPRGELIGPHDRRV